MKYLPVLVLLILAVPAGAQQPRQATATELQGVVSALVAQRDTAQQLHANEAGKVAALAEENARLKAQLEELQKKAEPKKE